MSQFKVGDKVVFKGYGQLPEGMAPVFAEGETVEITEVKDDEGYIAKNAAGAGDTVYYPDEVEVLAAAPAKPTRTRAARPAAEPAKAEEVKAAEAPAAKPARGRATTKPAAEPAPAPVAEVKAEEAKPASKLTRRAKAAEPAKVEAKAPALKGKKADAKAAPEVKGGKAKVEKKAAKPKAEVKPAKTKTETAPIQIVNTQAVDDALAEFNNDALAAAKSLVTQAEETYFSLGGVLAHVYYEGTYKKLGYDSKKGFSDYVEKELGVAYRKAMYLINIYTHFTGLGVDETRLTEIGWSFAKEMVGVATDENFDGLVDFAKEHTREEFIEHIKTNYVEAKEGTKGATEPSEKVKMTKYAFKAFADQSEIIDRSIARAKELTGSDDMNAAMAHIITEWASLTEGVEVSIEDAVSVLETNFDVSVDVFDKDGTLLLGGGAEQQAEGQAA